MKFVAIILCCIAVVHAGPVAQEDTALRVIIGNFVNCMNSDISLCLKEHALKATERLNGVRKLDVIEGVTFYNNGPKEGRSFDTLPTDPEERNKLVTERLWKSTSDLFQKSDLELSYAGGDDDDDVKESRALDDDVGESRGKKKKAIKKKLKLLIPLAILGKIKAIILIVAALLIIAASVFKIALLAKIAFIAKVFAIIKALIAKKHSQEEHAVHIPAYEEHGPSVNAGWEGGWSRSRNEANGLAYSAYRQ